MTAEQYLADQLERLMGLPLASKEDEECWDREAADVQTTLEKQFPDFGLEHFLYHFFTDSDIRWKDAGYRERQHRAVAEYVARLRHDKHR